MNEKGNILPSTDSDKVVIVGKNEKKFEQVTHQMKVEKGHTMFEINLMELYYLS